MKAAVTSQDREGPLLRPKDLSETVGSCARPRPTRSRSRGPGGTAQPSRSEETRSGRPEGPGRRRTERVDRRFRKIRRKSISRVLEVVPIRVPVKRPRESCGTSAASRPGSRRCTGLSGSSRACCPTGPAPGSCGPILRGEAWEDLGEKCCLVHAVHGQDREPVGPERRHDVGAGAQVADGLNRHLVDMEPVGRGSADGCRGRAAVMPQMPQSQRQSGSWWKAHTSSPWSIFLRTG